MGANATTNLHIVGGSDMLYDLPYSGYNLPYGIPPAEYLTAVVKCNNCGDTWEIECVSELGWTGPLRDKDLYCYNCKTDEYTDIQDMY